MLASEAPRNCASQSAAVIGRPNSVMSAAVIRWGCGSLATSTPSLSKMTRANRGPDIALEAVLARGVDVALERALAVAMEAQAQVEALGVLEAGVGPQGGAPDG